MKIKVEKIVDMVRPQTVVHVGASTGAEVDHYIASGVEKIVLVEPIPSIAEGLAEKWGSGNKVVIYECACMDYDGEIAGMFGPNPTKEQKKQIVAEQKREPIED